MTKPRDEDDEAASILGAYLVGGARFGGARFLGGLLGEGRSGLADLGPAPIGSDPWLAAEIRRALAREPDLDTSGLQLDVREAIVTLRGSVRSDADRALVERAARTVQGIKELRIEL